MAFTRTLKNSVWVAPCRLRVGMPPKAFSHRFTASGNSLFGGEEHRFALRRGCSQEVEGSVDAPDGRDRKGQQWFLDRAKTEGRSDQIERHADEIGEQTEAR